MPTERRRRHRGSLAAGHQHAPREGFHCGTARSQGVLSIRGRHRPDGAVAMATLSPRDGARAIQTNEGDMKEARLFGHPIHPMLIVFPLGLLPTAVLFDIVYLATGNNLWTTVSFWVIPVGLIGGLLAAVFGLIDWLGIPAGTRAKRVGALHGIGNVIVVGFFALSWLIRAGKSQIPDAKAIALAIVGLEIGRAHV